MHPALLAEDGAPAAGEAEGASSFEVRKALRAQRKQALADKQAQKPGAGAEDPADVSAVERAQRNMGDYKLKSAADYEVRALVHKCLCACVCTYVCMYICVCM